MCIGETKQRPSFTPLRRTISSTGQLCARTPSAVLSQIQDIPCDSSSHLQLVFAGSRGQVRQIPVRARTVESLFTLYRGFERGNTPSQRQPICCSELLT